MEKGQYGYINDRQRRQIRMTFFSAAFVVLFAGVGFVIWGTKFNILMIPAMLCVIPLANFLVTYLALARYSTGNGEQYAALQAFEEAGMLLSDMVVVDEKGGRAHMDFAVVYQNGIAGYQSDKKDARDSIVITVNDVLKRRGIPMRIKVFRDWDEFSERISEMHLPSDEDAVKRIDLAKQAVLSVCL